MHEKAQLLLVFDHCTSDGVEKAEVRCSIENNALDRGGEASIQPGHSVRLHNLPNAVRESFEFPICFFADIGGKPSARKVQWVDDYEARTSCCASRCQVAQEITPKLLSFVDSSQEELLVRIPEGEVEGLLWKDPHHIDPVPTP